MKIKRKLGEQYLFQTKQTAKRDKAAYYMLKGSSQQGDITTVYINIYVPNTEAPSKYIKKILTNIKAETDTTTVVEDVNTPLTSMDRSSRQKTSKETLALNDTCD